MGSVLTPLTLLQDADARGAEACQAKDRADRGDLGQFFTTPDVQRCGKLPLEIGVDFVQS
ncbi:MAG: hypothetical protein ACI8UO_005653, partial [Verrucomicrobiales bacterium]